MPKYTRQENEMRYGAAAHAMQSGVKFDLASEPSSGTPKHLRAGVNSALANDAALAKLLVAKGVFTEDEYMEAIADAMEDEQRRYEIALSARHQRKVTLG